MPVTNTALSLLALLDGVRGLSPAAGRGVQRVGSQVEVQETELFKTLRERLKLDKRTKLEAIAAAVDLYPKVSMYPCVARDLPRNEQDSGDARAAAQLPRAA